MNNIYSTLLIVSVVPALVLLISIIRWANDASFSGWRLRRWEARGVPKSQREWTLWFAWRPVQTVAGKRVWLATVYRKIGNDYSDMDDWTWYYYGTVFDALKDKHE